ncbi:MAG: uracil phosphoribosyltransferase [Rhodobacteraceae bacterium]|nr:uracil phosphoribosyltransferase [Paracoccaceae bacterium]
MTAPMPIILTHPLVQDRLSQMRQPNTPPAVFRALLRQISMALALEATRDLPLASRDITTPLQGMAAPVLARPEPVLVSILRAGNGMLDGLQQFLPDAPVGFVGLYRDEATLRPVQYYCKLPDGLGARRVLVLDPMLATGNTAVAAVDLIKAAGAHDIWLLALLAAPEGADCLHRAHRDVTILTAALDERLNDKGYILPGLGDAGDRIFGTG